jgi:hypothetical protein
VDAVTDGVRIVRFYEGNGTDDRGRSLADIVAFDDGELERIHDFIQWLFPLRERSSANPDAPRLDEATIEAFRARPELRAALRRSFDRMLAFYGFRRAGERVAIADSFAERSGWLTPGNHNHLRLTRMLKSLRLLGDEPAALALFHALADIEAEERRSGSGRISARTYRFWREAIEST